MPDTRTVDVAIPVEAGIAAALGDEARRALVGRLVSRLLRPASAEHLDEVMEAISVEAEGRGLTEGMLEAELAAYNSANRDAPPSA